MSPTLAAFDWLNGLLIVGFLFVSVVMILIVLIQRPQGGGLSGAFGSAAGSGQTAFGARTGDALTIATVGIFVVFLITAAVLNHTVRPPKALKQGASVTAPASGTPSSGATPAPATGEAQPATGAAPPPAGEQPAATPPAAPEQGATPAAQPGATPATNPSANPPVNPPANPPAEQPAPATPPSPTP